MPFNSPPCFLVRVQSVVQNLLNDLGDIGRRAQVNTTMAVSDFPAECSPVFTFFSCVCVQSDGHGVDINIDFGNINQVLEQQEINERFRSAERMLTRLRLRIDRIEVGLPSFGLRTSPFFSRLAYRTIQFLPITYTTTTTGTDLRCRTSDKLVTACYHSYVRSDDDDHSRSTELHQYIHNVRWNRRHHIHRDGYGISRFDSFSRNASYAAKHGEHYSCRQCVDAPGKHRSSPLCTVSTAVGRRLLLGDKGSNWTDDVSDEQHATWLN